MDSWLTALLGSAGCSIGTKSSFTISFSLNFLLLGIFDFLEGVEVDGIFPSLVGFLDEGFRSTVGFSIIVGSLGDGVFLARVLVGDLVRDLVGDLVGDLVREFLGSVSMGGLGSFVREGGGVCISDTDRYLGGEEIREIDGDFDSERGIASYFSLMVVGLTLGE